MTYSYFPGCTLKTKAKDLDHYARISAEALGFTLEELPDWQCCGGVYPMAKNEIATKLSSIRALAKAKELGQPLVTLCSACHNVIKQVNHDMQTDDNIVLKANNYLKLAEPYQGETEVLHYLEVLRDKVGFDELKKKVVNPLKGKKIAAYYGQDVFCSVRERPCRWIIRRIRRFWKTLSVQLVQHRYCIRCGTNAAAAI